MEENIGITRRDALKASGGLVGGLALGSAMAGSATAQGSYYRYDSVRVRLVDADARPPRFHTVERALYLTEPSLADCDASGPCGLDVLDYSIDDDDNDDDDGDDDGSDNDDSDDDSGSDDNDDSDGSDDGSADDDSNDDDDDDDDRGCSGFASVTLLCNADSESNAVVLTGLMPDVLSEYDDRDFDFVVGLEPSEATNVEDPETVSSPCPTSDDDDSDDGNDNDDTTGDDDSGDDTGGDDNGDDTGSNDDGADDGDDTGADDGDDDSGGDDDTTGDDDN